MSKETLEYLSRNTLIGFTDKRGNAWHHREGNNNHFPGPVPRERALELLSYPLAEASVSATVTEIDEDGVTERVFGAPDRKAVVRTDTGLVLGVFKQGYQIHQPAEWCLQNVDLILDGGLQIGSVVVLKGGAVAALQAELDETREGPEGIKHRPFLTAATSHDGSIATTYMTGTQVVVCDNTLSAALGATDTQKTKIRHSSQSLTRIGSVRENLGLVVEQIGDAFDAQVQTLLDAHVSASKWNAFVKAYTGVDVAKEGRAKTMAETKVKQLNYLWTADERVAPWKGSAYGVLAAVNTAQHHIFGSEKTREERNQMRVVTGDWDSIDQSTIKLLASV